MNAQGFSDFYLCFLLWRSCTSFVLTYLLLRHTNLITKFFLGKSFLHSPILNFFTYRQVYHPLIFNNTIHAAK